MTETTKVLHDENITREVSRIIGMIRKEMETILPFVKDPGFRNKEIREAVERVAELARWKKPPEGTTPEFARSAIDRAQSLSAFYKAPFLVVQDMAHQRLLVISRKQYEEDPPFGVMKIVYETRL